jgi:hypothetical protein
MSNKYADKAKTARAARRRHNHCTRKVAYETEGDAYQKGQVTYQCRYCGKFHRSGSLADMTSYLRKRNQ